MLTLRNPDRPDQLLDQAAADKIHKYREPYARNRSLAFLSGRIHSENLRLLYFLANNNGSTRLMTTSLASSGTPETWRHRAHACSPCSRSHVCSPVLRYPCPPARYLANRSHLPLAPSCAARALPACSPDRYFCFLRPCTTFLLPIDAFVVFCVRFLLLQPPSLQSPPHY